MAVAFDAAGTAATAGATTTFTEGASTITVGSGSNRVLALLIQFGAVVSSVTAFWDEAGTNQAMTGVGNIAETDNLGSTYIFGLIAPTSGAKLLKVSWTGSASYTYCMVSYTGADQGSVAGTFRNFVSANPATTSGNNHPYPPSGGTVNSASGDIALASYGTNNATLLTTSGTGTAIYALNTNVGGAGFYTAGAGASTAIACGASNSSSNPACWCGCDIAALGTVAGAGTQPGYHPQGEMIYRVRRNFPYLGRGQLG